MVRLIVEVHILNVSPGDGHSIKVPNIESHTFAFRKPTAIHSAQYVLRTRASTGCSEVRKLLRSKVPNGTTVLCASAILLFYAFLVV